MMGVVDFGRAGAVGPGEASGVGDLGVVVAVAGAGVVGAAGEEEFVGVGLAVVRPVGGVVDFGVVAGCEAVGVGAAAVTRVADEALIGGGDPFLSAQIQRPAGVVVEDAWGYLPLAGE
ncbi:hypothetical protein A9X00_28510 [Mycobacterium sp. 1245805.9]|nr:hypothetical protein A9X00_28510 [Mycobacterium sp. 1245805.9]